MCHFGIKKTLEIHGEHFYWFKMQINVDRVCGRCIACKKVKSKVLL